MSSRLRVKTPTSVAGPVHLDPGAVQLPLHRGRTDPVERLGDALRRLRQHRQHRSADLEPERGQGGGAAGQRGRRDRAQVTAEHHRPADVVRPQPRRPGDGVDHHAGQRALAKLADEQLAQEALLRRGGPGEDPGEQPAALRLRPGAALPADPLERRVHLGHAERRLRGRRRDVAQRRPAHPDLTLPQLPGEEGHRHRHLPRPRPGQRPGEPLDLAEPGRGGRHRVRGVREIAQQHPAHLPSRSTSPASTPAATSTATAISSHPRTLGRGLPRRTLLATTTPSCRTGR